MIQQLKSLAIEIKYHTLPWFLTMIAAAWFGTAGFVWSVRTNADALFWIAPSWVFIGEIKTTFEPMLAGTPGRVTFYRVPRFDDLTAFKVSEMTDINTGREVCRQTNRPVERLYQKTDTNTWEGTLAEFFGQPCNPPPGCYLVETKRTIMLQGYGKDLRLERAAARVYGEDGKPESCP